MEELQNSRKREAKKIDVKCWNCGERGHYARSCKKAKIGNGFTYRPRNKNHDKGEKSTKAQALN